MRSFLSVIFLLIFSFSLYSERNDTLYINFISPAPFAFKESGEIRGIEIDLISAYSKWLASKKNMKVTLKFSQLSDYSSLYQLTQIKSRNSFGLAAAIASDWRDNDIDFSIPYIKSVSFCITNANAVDIKIKNPDDITRSLGSMNAFTIKGSLLNKYVVDIKKSYLPDLKISFLGSETEILNSVSRNVLSFAYVDGIAFWNYLKNNPSRSLKIQRAMNRTEEGFGFILPKGCPHNPLFKEFFNTFKATSEYRSLLEKYLGAYMTQNVALN